MVLIASAREALRTHDVDLEGGKLQPPNPAEEQGGAVWMVVASAGTMRQLTDKAGSRASWFSTYVFHLLAQ